MTSWIAQSDLQHVIEISCNTCDPDPTFDLLSLDSDYRPFIVVNTFTDRRVRRQKRSLDCAAGVSECCREKLYISFAEIGWSDWILHPPGYDAYFCRGSCASAATITMSGSHYTSVLRVRTLITITMKRTLKNIIAHTICLFFSIAESNVPTEQLEK